MSGNNCVNILNYHRDASSVDGMVLSNQNSSASDSQLSQGHMSMCSTSRTVNNNEQCNLSLEAASVVADYSEASTTVICKDPFQFGFMDSSDVCYDTLMCRAYGCSLSQLPGVDHDSDWCSCWKQVIYHSGNHYILPGGPIGRRYVDLLAEEVTHLRSWGTFSI